MATNELSVIASSFAVAINLIRLSADLINELSSRPKTATSRKDPPPQQEEDSSKKEEKPASVGETTPLLANSVGKPEDGPIKQGSVGLKGTLPLTSIVFQTLVAAYLFLAFHIARHAGDTDQDEKHSAIQFRGVPLLCAGVAVAVGIVISVRDVRKLRFGSFQRSSLLVVVTLLLLSWVTTTGAATSFISPPRPHPMDAFSLLSLILYASVSLLEVQYTPAVTTVADATTDKSTTTSKATKTKQLSRRALATILKPYFWPDATDSSALLNRFLASLTWACVILAKLCNLTSPILLGRASTALTQYQYAQCIRYSVAYASIQFLGSFFREGQGLLYLKVGQAAFVQIAEISFRHILGLNLDWHLQKKLGEVVRSLDRGISACDTLMRFLFLNLLPSLAECFLVCIIFVTYFNYFPLAVAVFSFVFFYVTWTVLITLWRRKFRAAVAKSDNNWHERITDSLVNFETVKYFTAEQHELERFGDAVRQFQEGSVNVAASLSFLNLSQQLILQVCLATSLSLATVAIKTRSDCCVDVGGCAVGDVECCAAIDFTTCPEGLEPGDYVTVLTYTTNLFAPLNFLGTIYNAIVMALVDLTNLSELLAELPEVVDAPNAITLPVTNQRDPEVAVEFDNVRFRYPSQAEDGAGIRSLSFKMKRGTTTAVVGPSGTGKTTVSRLLFRFYDVLGGAIRVNGVDIRSVQQTSLREAIGMVPQSTTLFNDSIRENVRYGKFDATDEELEQAAQDAHIADFIHSLPEGWDTVVGDRGLKLSGGERQRVAIARCLLKNPPFVVLDEATSALDSVTEASVQSALDRLGSQRTVLVIAHRLGTIRNADNIVVLGNGGVAEEGTHDELLALNGSYAELWNMQLRPSSSGGALSNMVG